MTLFQAGLLGLIQGVTEFLPISSSGHLVIVQTLLGFQDPPILFDVIVHMGTLVAVIFFFFDRLKYLTKHLLIATSIATIPAVVAAILLKPHIDSLFSSRLVVAFGFILTSIFLIWTRFPTKSKSTKSQSITLSDAFVIGLFQAVAIIPGVSRSGSTVSAALGQGLPPSQAFYFSFLIAIPAILGAQALTLTSLTSLQELANLNSLLGFTAAAISGFLSLRLLKLIINSSKLHYFALYTFPLGLLLILDHFLG